MRWSIPIAGTILAAVDHLTSWWGIAIIVVFVLAHFLAGLAGGTELYTGAPTGEPDAYQLAAFFIVTPPMVVGLYIGNAIADALGAAIGSIALGLIGSAILSVLVTRSEVGFGRRRELRKWPPNQLAEHVLVGRSDERDFGEGEVSVRVGLLFHQDPKLFPRKATEEGDDFFEYIVLAYSGDAHNIVAYHTGTVEDMLDGIHGFDSEEEARAFLRSNYPEPDLSYAELPEIIRAAFIHLTRGTQPSLL